jgi:hypothetical protein
MSTDCRQQQTGDRGEASVKKRFVSLGFSATKRVPDRSVDLEVRLPGLDTPVVKIQVKSRGDEQTNGRFWWFQIRTTPAQREQSVSAGLPPSDAWEKKVRMCDFFVLWAQKFDEFWVLPQAQVLEVGRANRLVYGSRKDNAEGRQAELDLDIEVGGKPLTEVFGAYLDSFDLIGTELERRMAEQGDACDE